MDMGIKMYLWVQNAKRVLLSQKGQGMVEYGLIIAIIGLAVAATLPGVSDALSDMYGKVKVAIEKQGKP